MESYEVDIKHEKEKN